MAEFDEATGVDEPVGVGAQTGENAAAQAAEMEPVDAPAATPAEGTATESEAVRELIVKAYPEVVPELIQGTTLEEMLATLPAAQAAYQRIAGEIQTPPPAPIPAGGSSRSSEPDLAGMGPEQLIKQGLGTRD